MKRNLTFTQKVGGFLAWAILFFMFFMVGAVVLYPALEVIFGDHPPRTDLLIILSYYGFLGMLLLAIWLQHRRTKPLSKQKTQSLTLKFLGQRLSEPRRQHLLEKVPNYKCVPAELKPRLEELMHIFLDQVKFVPKGIEITEEMRDCVAAEACLLIINRSWYDYRHLKTVELWDDLVRGSVSGDATGARVRMHWKSVERSLASNKDTKSLSIHEFAHVLDLADDGHAQSIPVPANTKEAKAWETLLDNEFSDLVEAHESNHSHVIEKYGTTVKKEGRRPEFFTCATEAFFERSQRLQKECPDLYLALKEFYKIDPAGWRIKQMKYSDQKDRQGEVL